MRRRLINSTLAVVLVVVAVFGVSLFLVEASLIEASARDKLESEAARLVAHVESRIAAGEPVTVEEMISSVPADRFVIIDLADGTRRSVPVLCRPEIGDGRRVIEERSSGSRCWKWLSPQNSCT